MILYLADVNVIANKCASGILILDLTNINAVVKIMRSGRMFFLSAKMWRKKKKINDKKGGALLSDIKKLLSIFYAQERMSSCSPKKLKASMTVEACLILPVFLFAFLNIISIIELYRLQGNMSAAMHDTAKQMAIYGYEYKDIRKKAAKTAESLGLTYLYAANKVVNTLGTEYLNNSAIAGSTSSISWLKSEIMTKDDCIDLVAEYRIKPPIAIVGYGESVMYNRMRTRAWTGYDNANVKNSNNTEEQIVYITPEGTAYHASRSCAYLKLSIIAVDSKFLSNERNENGEKYSSCEECGNSCGSTVYITNYGNRYHASLSCSKLKRTILAVPLSQAGGRTPCMKCS